MISKTPIYKPDQADLGPKIAKHLRRKGWRRLEVSGNWVDGESKETHTFTAAIKIQLRREGSCYV